MLTKYRASRRLAREKLETAQYDAIEIQLKDIEDIGTAALESALSDGQIYIQSLYSAHIASDNRGLAFGSLLTSAGFALYVFPLLPRDSDIPSNLSKIATYLGVALFLCGAGSFASVWPKKFCVPGGPPEGWLSKNWFKPNDNSKKNVLVEQLKAIRFQVERNRELAKRKAYIQRVSLATAMFSIAVAGFISRFWF